MFKFGSPKAFKWLSMPEKFTIIMKACAKFYRRQIAKKFPLNFTQCITTIERLIQTRLLLLLLLFFFCSFSGPCPSAECLCSTS